MRANPVSRLINTSDVEDRSRFMGGVVDPKNPHLDGAYKPWRAYAQAKLANPRFVERAPDEEKAFRELQLLTSKPVLYVCNVDEASAATGNEFSKRVFEMAKQQGNEAVVVSAAIEAEVALLEDPTEQKEFLETLGLAETGLNRVIKAGYKLLDLKTFFTVGPKESKAWTIKNGMTAPQAAGVIHSDFEKGFIRAEVISYQDFVDCQSEAKARELGKLRSEGKTYVMQDGDICHFLFNV